MNLNGGYAMIKYNSTQEELQIAYKTKRPVLLYDADHRAHWAVIEETATESVDEETQEPITIYEYSYRLIDEASGGKLYHHHILIVETSSRSLTLNVVSSSNIPYTHSTLLEYIRNITGNATTSDDGYNCIARYDGKYGYCCMAATKIFIAMPYNGASTEALFRYSENPSVYDTITEV